MKKEEFEELMENFSFKTKEELTEKWYACFEYMLESFGVRFSKKAIKSLFKDFRMQNGKMFWKENNPDYKDSTTEQLINSFIGECRYISDRYTYDRIFRTHWLYLRIIENL